MRRFGKQLLTLAAAFALAGCAGELELDGAHAAAPYQIDASGIIVVAVRIDGKGPFDFAMDTAASISAVFSALREDLELESVPGKTVIVHGVVASAPVPLLEIDRLEIGTEVWTEPRMVALPGETAIGGRVDGVLGIDFLRRYAIGFLANDRFVRLYPPEMIAQRYYRGWTSIPLRTQAVDKEGPALYFMDIEVAGRKMPAVFDLGAGLNMINWPGARAVGFVPTPRVRDQQLSGAVGSRRDAHRFIADEVATSNIRWRDEVFSVADLNIFETLRLQDGPAAIVGAGLFTQRDFVIDFVRNRLLVRTALPDATERDSANDE